MHFHLPRRHRRKLLFPPGLLALAGLLWLGSVAVGRWRERLSRKVIIQVAFVPLSLPKNQCNNYDAPLLMPIAQLQLFRQWYDARFTGNTLDDSQEQKLISNAVREMMADSLHPGGVRIRFAPTANYNNLVFALDLMARERVQKYRLDLQHQPATLYAYTYLRPRPSQEDVIDFVDYGSDIIFSRIPEPSPASAFVTYGDDLIIAFRHPVLFQKLMPTKWTTAALMLIAIMALGILRLI
jgi:hypothetical protein